MKNSLETYRKTRRNPNGSARRVVHSVALATSLALTTAAAFGQGITGSITGRVTDPTGAEVVGASVTVRDLGTGAVHTITTSAVGSYTVPQLPPGKYAVKVDSPSFQSYQQDNITLQIDQVAEIDAQLSAGSTSDTVVVTSEAPVIQTDDSSIGQVIDSQAIQNTPLNGRLGLNGLIALAPGVQAAGAQDQLATRGITVSVGTGGRNAYGGLGSTLDGVTNQEVTLQRAEAEVPSLDAIAEFKVLSNGAPAQFMQPAQLIVVSASGTNKLHGEAFEFNRSKGTGAKSYFSGSTPRPPYERNEFGGNLSGPIFIPHVYDGRDKSFFFAAYEQFRLTQSYFDNTTQPTVLQRQGNFSEYLAGGACNSTTTSIIIKNPLTGLPYPGNIINSGLNPVSVQLLNKLYPMPTAPGCGANTSEQVQEQSHSSRFSLRLDHSMGEKNQFRFTFLRAFYGPSPTNGTDSLQGGNSLDGEHNTNAIVGWTHTFSPTLLIDTYASYFHLPIFRTPQNVNTDFSSIIPGLGPELIQGAPQINITNITAVSESGSKDLEQVMQANTVVTKVLAKHTIKVGAGYLFDNHWNDAASSPARGQYTFTNHYSGIAFADFLLGYPVTTAAPTPNNYITRNLSSQISAFIQDDWKPMQHLTFNLGLRYDRQVFEQDPYGHNSLYIPSLKQVVVFGSSYPSSSIPQYLTSIPITLGPSVGLGTNVFNYLGQDKKNFAPRFGFAYEAAHNTVVRGAFGIYFNLLPASYVGTGAFDTLPFLGIQNYTNNPTTPSFSMSNAFSATGAFGSNPGVNAEHPLVTPYTEQYNLAVEHQFGKGFDLRVGYVGQHNLKQNNYGGPGTTSPNINISPYPVVGSTVQSNNLIQPFAAIPYILDPIYHSNANSLQIGLHKQYNHGITFGAEYQWIRALGTENIENPSGVNPNDSFGPISGITPQVLALNYSYLLPFGKGQRFFGTSNNFIDKLVSGFQFSGITNIQTGQPFSVTYAAPSGTGTVGGRASIVPGVPLYPSHKTKAMWFNPAAFTAPTNAAGVAGGAYGNSGYDMLRGPAFQDWDMNLQKNIGFHDGRFHVQLRADAFNVFNHANLNTPNASISNTASVGTITSVSSTPLYEPRQIEFAGKFVF
jgi:hypothetical protein